jgi:hypothetical protein
VPPLRRHAPHVPRDLGTIVAHAMELEPERRYQDGQAFADDLQRLLELQPILARPPGMLRRTAKFLRRHSRPLLAGCLGAVLVAAFLLPLLNQAQAAERNLAAAREHVRTARQALLAPECRSATWQPRHGTGKPGEVALEESAMATLQRAAAEYGEALALLPDAVSTQRELAVVRMLIWLRQLAVVHADSLNEAMARPEYQTIAAALPPAVRAFAEATAAGRTHEQDADVVLQACSDADRHSLGLLAFLVGELRWCELAWTNITATPEDQALRDAGLGLLYLNEGAPRTRLRSSAGGPARTSRRDAGARTRRCRDHDGRDRIGPQVAGGGPHDHRAASGAAAHPGRSAGGHGRRSECREALYTARGAESPGPDRTAPPCPARDS